MARRERRLRFFKFFEACLGATAGGSRIGGGIVGVGVEVGVRLRTVEGVDGVSGRCAAARLWRVGVGRLIIGLLRQRRRRAFQQRGGARARNGRRGRAGGAAAECGTASRLVAVVHVVVIVIGFSAVCISK